jgi:hypothetical protein
MTAEWVTTKEDEGALPAGTWVIADDGTEACLFDTHLGFPQRMWGVKLPRQGRVLSYQALGSLPFPLYVSEVIEPEGFVCPHRHWNECGQCQRCGKPEVGESHEMFFDEQGMRAFRIAAEHNSRLKATS